MRAWLAMIVMLVSLSMAILFASGGCATFQKVKEPVKVEMVLLTELTFQGEVSGIKGPVQFGDFTVTHYIVDGVAVGDMAELTFAPFTGEVQIVFILHAKADCPEGIALSTANAESGVITYWIYDANGQIWQVDKEKYDYFLTLDHPCVVAMPEGIDATLSI